MFVKAWSCSILALVVLCLCSTGTLAAPPWSKLVLFKHLETDPGATYSISDSNGPWMIMAASFTGDGAEEQARKLVYELRSTYKLPAYSYQKKFDFSQSVNGKGRDEYGEPLKMRYSRNGDLVEIAVLVGDYPTVDDPEAQKVLKRLKYATPKSLAVEAENSSQSLAAIRAIQRDFKKKFMSANSEDLKRGPMASAFMIANPHLPPEYFVPKGIDKFVVDMNKEVPHSLLDCTGRYTIKVATFNGTSILLDRKAMDALEKGATPESRLEKAAANAHTLTEALRKKGYEAYEFHDRSTSIVTVGSFDSVGQAGPDGKFRINPAVEKTMNVFGAATKRTPGAPAEVGKPKELAGIRFDIQPVPVEVPARNISVDYSRTAATRDANTLR